MLSQWDQNSINYQRIEKAIHFINDNFKAQPSLEEIASVVNLSPFHFQRVFSKWAGVTPKKFIQFISLEYAKSLLKNNQSTLFDAAYEAGLSGSSRLHDLFINIEAMTPGEFKSGGKGLNINYSFSKTPFGPLIIASTVKGVCHVFFDEDKERAVAELKNRFPGANYSQCMDHFQLGALQVFHCGWPPVSG